VEAAAAMGQVRGLLRGIAVHSGDAPAAILSGLDTVMQSLQLETTATAVVARFEQVGPTSNGSAQILLRWSHAGHPPALLVDHDGIVTRLADADANDLLLGFDPATARHEGVVALEAGATLVLYTDGLVERRDRDIEDGIEALERLLAEVAPETTDLDHLCDRLLGAMASEVQEDDVALLVVRWAPDAA